MASTENIIRLLETQGMLPLFYHNDAAVCRAIADALYTAGVRLIEFTNRGEQALANFANLVEERNKRWPGLLLAAGTIKTAGEATRFLEAGADFIISPGIVKEVAQEADAIGTLWVPGCMTPSEIILAETLGARLVKLFPGQLLGPGFVNSIKNIFPGLRFMPTGGVEVNEENLRAWFSAGVCAVGLGSKLISAERLQKKAYGEIQSKAAEALAIIQTIR